MTGSDWDTVDAASAGGMSMSIAMYLALPDLLAVDVVPLTSGVAGAKHAALPNNDVRVKESTAVVENFILTWLASWIWRYEGLRCEGFCVCFQGRARIFFEGFGIVSG
mmetsp:Transcript_11256/g.23564  ORF Transcript_11256/g.23564 Transcript_11256/m.23564 type:complete len:108 (-) Transcript_11256:120-443(-)